MRESFIETASGRIWYSVYGEEKPGTPILVVHGGPGFLSMPQVVDELADNRPVYFYDQLGSGRSDTAKNPDFYSVNNYIQELDEIRQNLNLAELILMGFSWGGGLIGSYMLEKKPEGVKALILSAPLLSTPMWDKDQRENISRMPRSVINSIEKGEQGKDYGDEYQEAMMEYYKKHVCRMDPWPDYLDEALGKLSMDVYLTMWGPSEFTITGKLKDFDLYPDLNKISAPVLLICGDSDEAGVKTMKDYQMAFPNAQLAVIPNSCHMHHIEQPPIYKTVVREFLKNL